MYGKYGKVSMTLNRFGKQKWNLTLLKAFQKQNGILFFYIEETLEFTIHYIWKFMNKYFWSANFVHLPCGFYLEQHQPDWINPGPELKTQTLVKYTFNTDNLFYLEIFILFGNLSITYIHSLISRETPHFLRSERKRNFFT